MSAQAFMGLALVVWMAILVLVGAEYLDRLDARERRREERAAARSSRQDAARSTRPPAPRPPASIRELTTHPGHQLAWNGQPQPDGMSLDDWLADVLGDDEA